MLLPAHATWFCDGRCNACFDHGRLAYHSIRPKQFCYQRSGELSAIIELDPIQLLLQLFGLPKAFMGGFVTGATMFNFTCLAVARQQWAGKPSGSDIAKEGVIQAIHVLSTMPHSSSIKSPAMLGMGSNNFHKVRTLEGNRKVTDSTDLEQKLMKLGVNPLFLSAAVAR